MTRMAVMLVASVPIVAGAGVGKVITRSEVVARSQPNGAGMVVAIVYFVKRGHAGSPPVTAGSDVNRSARVTVIGPHWLVDVQGVAMVNGADIVVAVVPPDGAKTGVARTPNVTFPWLEGFVTPFRTIVSAVSAGMHWVVPHGCSIAVVI